MSVLGLTLGALEVGVLCSSVLYGVATTQAFLYARGRFKDPIWLQIFVGFVWILETAHTVFIWSDIYSLTVINYGNPETINGTSWSPFASILFTSLLGTTVQSFFGYRVWMLSERLIIPLIIWLGSIFRLGFGSAAAIRFLQAKSLTAYLERDQWMVTTALVISTVIDIINTSALCVYLRRRRSTFKSTQRIVDKLMMYSIETGLICSACTLTTVICSLAMPDNLVYFGMLMIYAKLFSNSLLTSLNARRVFRHGGPNGEGHVLSSEQASSHEDSAVALEVSFGRSNHSNTIHPDLSLSQSFDIGTTKVLSLA
ncbi:hypothetical protein JB92DRAFT_3000838 [Gautieria morchelliformis]|nr:hypothetical protein JB92DRAFT_3000838 [Gautieria morchelliformis]